MTFTWWDETDGTRLYLLTDWTDLATLQSAEQQAREHLAANPTTQRPVLGANVFDEAEREIVLAAGFGIAFSRVQLAIELTDAERVELPVGLELRPAGPEDHRAVFEGNAEVFRERSLGYTQDTFEEFEKDVAEDFPDYSLWQLAWAGDELAGWVISGVESDGTADTPWVGVRTAWRRLGLASTLLRMNHHELWSKGVRTARLWTIAENPTGSVALYEGLGYRIEARQPRYRKAV
ncbi:GNAT family N-acetyltransferase [Kribbella sp. NPDC056861]|uniref:GNAT family N-acetyltransferase n=1 Tax=Kribbella sp. NPDC056861 TaxID=3154857 RepID=UPI00342854AD